MEELHQQAGMIAESYFQSLQRQVTERYREISGNNQELASEDMKEVVKAAYYPRIDSLFVAIGHQQWDSFDPQNRQGAAARTRTGWGRELVRFLQRFKPL